MMHAERLEAQRAAPPQPLLLCWADEGFDPTGWLMAEKLNGCRGYWDGARLWSKDGNLYRPPEAWAAALPRYPLDGELWIGRGAYQAVRVAVQRKIARPEEWEQIRLRVFDGPAAPGGFAERLAAARRMVAGHHHVAEVIPHFLCAGREQADRVYRAVLAAGGEGMVYRAPDAPYEHGYSKAALKRKPRRGRTTAPVVRP